MACAGAPVTDPRNGQVLGVIDITCSVTNANALMMPLAKRAAWEIEQRLRSGAPAIERLLDERFRDARRRAKGPVALVTDDTLMTNSAAAGLVQRSDRALLWAVASRMIADDRGSREVMLGTGVVVTGCEPVLDGGLLVGALVLLSAPRDEVEANGNSAARPTVGWGSLTESECSVADLVAEGLTNREVATRLFLSRYTVDAHLRHIFHKLGIRSRVELARMVADHGKARAPVAS
jgi:DNA-binding CsgD family transcriptional regulator